MLGRMSRLILIAGLGAALAAAAVARVAPFPASFHSQMMPTNGAGNHQTRRGFPGKMISTLEDRRGGVL